VYPSGDAVTALLATITVMFWLLIVLILFGNGVCQDADGSSSGKLSLDE